MTKDDKRIYRTRIGRSTSLHMINVLVQLRDRKQQGYSFSPLPDSIHFTVIAALVKRDWILKDWGKDGG